MKKVDDGMQCADYHDQEYRRWRPGRPRGAGRHASDTQVATVNIH
jgi:hypothetical protein